MPVRTSYEPGTPSWVEVRVPDLRRAAAFYGGLLGWRTDTTPDRAAPAHGLFTLRDHVVAGVGPLPDPGGAPGWSVSITVSDADETVARVTRAGGTVLVEPTEVLDAGRRAVFEDSVGATISIWQPKARAGVELVNEIGAFSWNELTTSDLPAADDFYRSVFGWGLDPADSSEHASAYTVDGGKVCGAHVAGDHERRGWTVWFIVADCDASVATATSPAAGLGGSLVSDPMDMDFGRGAVLTDDQGAVFALGSFGPT